MPTAEYEHRTDSVLAWKRTQKLGRFDPDAPSIEQQKVRASEREVEERGKRYFFFCTPVYEIVRLRRRRSAEAKPKPFLPRPLVVAKSVVLACKPEMLQRFPNWTAVKDPG
jgi:hypothetical protein